VLPGFTIYIFSRDSCRKKALQGYKEVVKALGDHAIQGGFESRGDFHPTGKWLLICISGYQGFAPV
jgi:hypothetical protein